MLHSRRAAQPPRQHRPGQAMSGPSGVRRGLTVLVLCAIVLCAGCSGLFLPSGPGDREIQALIDRNTRNLRRLQVGLFQEYVSKIMGRPQRVEVYPWGTAWLYRTAKRTGTQRVAEPEFTPLVFDRTGLLVGWGADALSEQVKRDEQTQ